MSKPIQVKTYVDLDVKGISKAFNNVLDNTNRSSAKMGASLASSVFAMKYKAVAPYKHFQHIYSSFKATQSIYGKKGGWIFGPMTTDRPEPGTRGGWENTLGGRSFFFEYGRMPAGGGRDLIGRAAYKAAGGNIDAEGQPARPYMRPAKEALIPIHKKTMERRCNRLTKRLNRKYTSSGSSWKTKFTATRGGVTFTV